MSILEDLTALLPVLDVPMETGVFSNMAPDQYLVIVPLSDSFDLHADNEPGWIFRKCGFPFTRKAATQL